MATRIRTHGGTSCSAIALANARILAAALLFAAVMGVSCHKRIVQPVVPPPITPAAVPDPAAAPSPAIVSYEAAEKNFDAGNYPAAVKGYEASLRANLEENQDRVHFRLGLAYAFAADSAQNLRESRNHFQRVVSQYGKGPYRAPAELILSLLSEIEKLNGNVKEQQTKIKTLTEELQRLKAIDMQRHPSRPPE